MRDQRFRRYMEKIERVKKRFEEISKWSNSFMKDEKTRLAVYKAFQEISEALMDIVAMIIKDKGLMPEDDYQNIQKLHEEGLINEKTKGALSEINGLRNRVVHEYNGLDHKIALDSMKELESPVRSFLKKVKKWLKKEH